MKHNLKTIEDKLPVHWASQDKVSYEALRDEINGFKEELQQLNQKLLEVFPDLELRFPTDDNAAFWYAKGKLDKSKDVLGENQK